MKCDKQVEGNKQYCLVCKLLLKVVVILSS